MAFKHINAQTQTTPSILLTIDPNARALTPITIYNGHSASIFVGDASIATSGATKQMVAGLAIIGAANADELALIQINPHRQTMD